MARHFGKNIAGDGVPPTPSVEALSGLQPMERRRAEVAMKAQDKVVPQSRRILWRTGLNGDDAWLVPNTAVGVNTHPLVDEERPNTIGKFDITPGCTLRATCLHLPSGMTDGEGGANPFAAGVQGLIHFVTTWTAHDATTETRTYVMHLDGSGLANGSEDTGAAGLQRSLRLNTVSMRPPVDLTEITERNKWSRPFSVEIEIRYVGSPRVVDLAVYEWPSFYVMEADDPADEWVLHLFPDDKHTVYPVDEREDTGAADRDKRMGTLQTLQVADNQRKRLGPQLIHWNPYTETDADVTDTVLPSVNIGFGAAAGWRNVLNVAQSSTADSTAVYDADEPGWSTGCGGYARSWLHNNSHVMGVADAVATAPVLLRVRAENNDTDPIRLRLHTADYSWIDLEIAGSAALGWHDAWGYVTVGLNPEQHVVAQLLIEIEGPGEGTDLDIYAVEAYVWDGSFAPV